MIQVGEANFKWNRSIVSCSGGGDDIAYGVYCSNSAGVNNDLSGICIIDLMIRVR